MQIADNFSKNAPLPLKGGGTTSPETSAQLRRMRQRYRFIHLRRSFRFWWYRILIVLIGTLVATQLGPLLLSYPKEIIGGAAALVLIFWAIRRLEFGLILFALCATAISPKALSLKSVDIYPAHILVFLLLFVILAQMAFRVREYTLPSFWTIWPQLGLIAMAIISEIMIQVTWIQLVPHHLNTTPLIYSQVLGIIMYCFPLMTIIITTACVSINERLIEGVQRAFLIAGALAALVIGFEFKRIGADIYTFRYTEPVIIYMSLRALAQLMGLAAIIAYVRLLTAKSRKEFLLCAVLLVMYLASVYFTLENSWWVEVAVAFVVITLVYSRRLALTLGVLCLPLLPLLKGELAKLQSVKSADAYRLIIWQDSLRLWEKRPILGVGPGNFWPYDQVFTQLPFLLRNFNNTGLGVAHNGTLQILGELGPLGVVFFYSFVAVVVYTAFRIYRRSKAPEERDDRRLALICIGLVLGSIAGDFFSGSFFLPPRQIGSFQDLPQVLSTWIMFGCLFYKDKIWRKAQQTLKFNDAQPELG
ncbi:MAG TPA: O-antigen ligase family protein [Ktedonobacteraceae bacterium]|nr:O-antigen ligase family protein [Ktedonobacteraceae bacterium]